MRASQHHIGHHATRGPYKGLFDSVSLLIKISLLPHPRPKHYNPARVAVVSRHELVYTLLYTLLHRLLNPFFRTQPPVGRELSHV